MPPIGRPPLVRGVYSFEAVAEPPSELVLDTSFVVDALYTSQPLHAACQTFLVEVAGARSTVFFNRLLEAELWEATFQIALKERHPKDWRRYRSDGRARRRAERLLEQVETAWAAVLGTLDWVCIELDEVSDWVPDVMSSWGLASYDAVHAATVLFANAPALVTLDRHFGFVPEREFDLYVDAAAVRACRDRRRKSG